MKGKREWMGRECVCVCGMHGERECRHIHEWSRHRQMAKWLLQCYHSGHTMSMVCTPYKSNSKNDRKTRYEETKRETALHR